MNRIARHFLISSKSWAQVAHEQLWLRESSVLKKGAAQSVPYGSTDYSVHSTITGHQSSLVREYNKTLLSGVHISLFLLQTRGLRT